MFEGYGGPIRMDQADLSGIDPTLDSCCQRELEGNRKQNALEATLKRHDRIALAERRKRNLVDGLTFGSGCRCCYDPKLDGGEYYSLMQLRSKQEHEKAEAYLLNSNANGLLEDEAENGGRHRGNSDGDSDSDDDSEFDYLLDDDLPTSSGNNIGNDNHNGNEMSTYQSFQQERMEELQVNALIYESALHHGFGAHRQISAQRVLHCAGMGMGGIKQNRAAAIPPAAVVHLYKDNDMCASLDLCLEELSQTYRGTKYVRADGRDTLSMNAALVKETLPMSKLSTDSGIPALLAVRDGVVVAVCPNLSALGNERDGTIEPRAVEHWLDNARVLLLNVPLEFEDYCRIRPEEDALLENMMREKAKLDEMKLKEMIYNCGVSGCCKTFRHEHVGVQNEMQSGLLCKETNTGEMIGGGV